MPSLPLLRIVMQREGKMSASLSRNNGQAAAKMILPHGNSVAAAEVQSPVR
jgi:hypothetical protein